MVSFKILVVDDDPAIRNLVHRFLSQHNYQVESAEDGATALVLFKEFQPDLVVLDINLPDTTGFQLCQEMKSYNNVLVLMLTILCDEEIIVKCLEFADDYLKKPFSLKILLARIRRLLKLLTVTYKPTLDILRFGDLVIDFTSREVKFKNQIIPLTNIQFKLLSSMAKKRGYAWERAKLCKEVWDDGDDEFKDNSLDVHVAQIRKKLRASGCDFEYIVTVWKVGYKFEAPAKNDSL